MLSAFHPKSRSHALYQYIQKPTTRAAVMRPSTSNGITNITLRSQWSCFEGLKGCYAHAPHQVAVDTAILVSKHQSVRRAVHLPSARYTDRTMPSLSKFIAQQLAASQDAQYVCRINFQPLAMLFSAEVAIACHRQRAIIKGTHIGIALPEPYSIFHNLLFLL